MLALLVALWTISIILIVADHKTETTRWMAAFCFFSGLGGLAVVINDSIIPYFAYSKFLQDKFVILRGISASLSHYIAPYSLLIYGIVFSDIFKEKWQSIRYKVMIILLLPTALMYFLFPIYPAFKPYYIVLSIWCAPYILIGNLLMIYSYIKTKDNRVKQQKLQTCIIVTPGTFAALFTNYLLRIFYIDNAFFINVWIILLQFIAFIYFSIQQGALGVKLSLEKNSMDKTMKAMTSGTSILNHTIKNEVAKISMCMENIRYLAHEQVACSACAGFSKDINENIGIVNNSTSYLSVMINKIQSQVKDIVLDKKMHRLDSIVDRAIAMTMPNAKTKNITIIRNHSGESDMINICCDELHLLETINNVLNNSIEAIKADGTIDVLIEKKNKSISILIRDNGAGISKENLPMVIEPFFSTKKRSNNFGLGLSYCYGVMNKHGGTIEISSEEGVGTTVELILPVR